jgi:hypothetical protein
MPSNSSRTVTVDRETFHQMMRTLSRGHQPQSWTSTMRNKIFDTAEALANQTAVASSVPVIIELGDAA